MLGQVFIMLGRLRTHEGRIVLKIGGLPPLVGIARTLDDTLKVLRSSIAR